MNVIHKLLSKVVFDAATANLGRRFEFAQLYCVVCGFLIELVIVGIVLAVVAGSSSSPLVIYVLIVLVLALIAMIVWWLRKTAKAYRISAISCALVADGYDRSEPVLITRTIVEGFAKNPDTQFRTFDSF